MKVAEPDEDGDLLVTVFALPVAENAMGHADWDAPILAQSDLFCNDVGLDPENLPRWLDGKCIAVGETGLEPEWIEITYGQMLAYKMNEAIAAAIRCDARGVDMEGRPWRTPSANRVQSILLRTITQVENLGRRLGM
jgi:hypothetical protein